MKDQHAEIAPAERDHGPGGRVAPARQNPPKHGTWQDLKHGTRQNPPERGTSWTRTGRSRNTPAVTSLVALTVALTTALSGCTASQGATAPAADDRAAGPASEPSRTEPAEQAKPAEAAEPSATTPAGDGAATPPAEQAAGQAPAPPAPDAAIPTDPARLARSLTTTTARLRTAVDAWVRQGDPGKGNPPEQVVLLALHEQRIYRYLVRNREVATRTYARLPKALAATARDNVTAGRNLLSLVKPISGAAKFRVQPAEPADFLLARFKHAERRFKVDWEVLAAVMFVETKFGRVRSPSHTGAKGPMQFMPRTWDAYGMGGNIQDTRDALLAAANYLRASGAPRDYRRALYAYNHSYAYVDAVQLYARQIKRDIRNYYAYYNWQVFVVTTRGDRRLTGP
ncbi:transglycosylase SLT domain-containing protein [Streptosporangium sp. NPDC023615]|uniref:lytic transglycosylase domain-containing protein n=1 Tax=Streptosporangium sp. NPDC023615 TaxID=3154794 RepID=UPI00342BB86E